MTKFAMTYLIAASAFAMAGSAVTPAMASYVSGTVHGTIGTGGVTEVGGSVTVGTGAQPDDDPAPPITMPGTPGTTGPARGPDGTSAPVIPDATTDNTPSVGNGPDPDPRD